MNRPESPVPAHPSDSRAWWAKLLGIVCLGLILRLHGLGRESLWLDEGFTRTMARMPVGEMLEYAAQSDNNPPLLGLLTHPMLPLGDTEAVLRLVPALCGVLAIGVLGALGKRLYDPRTGLLAALLLATSAFHVGYSQEARPYSLLALLSLASTLGYAQWLEQPGRKATLGYLGSGTLLLYSHTYGGFTLLAQLLHALGWRRDRLVRLVALQGAMLVLFAPWLTVLGAQVQRVKQGFWLQPPAWSDLAVSLREFAGSWVLLAGLGLAAGWGLRRRGRALPVLLVLTTCLLPFWVSRHWISLYHTRYAISASLGLLLLASAGLSQLQVRGFRGLGPALGLLIAGLGLLQVRALHERIDKEQWREAAARIDAEARPSDLALFDAGFCLRHVYSAYARGAYTMQPFPAAKGPITPATLPELDELARTRDQIWLVLSHKRDVEGLVPARLLTLKFKEAERWKLVDIEVRRFTRRSAIQTEGTRRPS